MKKNATVFAAFLLLGCSAPRSKNVDNKDSRNNVEKESFVHFFKVQSFCSCLEQSYQNKEIVRLMEAEDLFGSYDQLANKVIQDKIMKIAKDEATKISQETYGDFDGKKRIVNSCLLFYQGKKLDSIAKSEAEKIFK